MWDKVNKELAHIDLPKHKEKTLISHFENNVRDVVDFNGKKVMDYGCGGGYFAEWLTKNYDVQYYGYDISRRSVQAAKKRNPKLTFTNSLFEIPCADIIICLAVIQHMTKDDLYQFKRYIEVTEPKEVFVQYRYASSITYNAYDLIFRTSIPKFEILGYTTTYTSEVDPNNKYKYELLRNNTSKKGQ